MSDLKFLITDFQTAEKAIARHNVGCFYSLCLGMAYVECWKLWKEMAAFIRKCPIGNSELYPLEK